MNSKRYGVLGLSVAAACWLSGLGSASASVLWDGDASKGTGVFGASVGSNCPNGTISVVNDSTWGKVFRFLCHDNGTTKTRCEGSRMKNFQPSNTGTYYFGWKQKWGPLPTKVGKWQVLEQVHLSGAGASGGPVPFGLHVPGDGQMHFQYQNPSGTPRDFWTHSLPLNSWHHYTYHIKMSTSESSGWVEFWYDGTMQTLKNGSKRYPSAWAHHDSTSYWKWGIYRSGSGGPIGDSYAYLARAKAGTTYADVD